MPFTPDFCLILSCVGTGQTVEEGRGRHYKSNYRITYDDLNKPGYTPPAAEYHRWMDKNKKLDQINRDAEQKGMSR